MGIKEQTVSVHIRGSYRYRRAPCNRNRRSKHASVSFPLCVCFLSFRSFAPFLPYVTRERKSVCAPPARSHYVRVHQLRNITRNHVAKEIGGEIGKSRRSRRRKKEEEEEYCPGERSAVIISRGEVSLGEKSRVRAAIKRERTPPAKVSSREATSVWKQRANHSLVRRSNYSTTYGSPEVRSTRVQGIPLIIAVRLAVYVARSRRA